MKTTPRKTRPGTRDAALDRSVGQRMRAIRERNEITQGEMAERTGFSQSTVSRLEAGGQPWTLTIRTKVAAALGVAPSELEGTNDGADALDAAG